MTTAPFVNARFRNLSDMADFLEEHFQPACIGPKEDLEAAHRRAGAVELATRIIQTIRGREPSEIEG